MTTTTPATPATPGTPAGPNPTDGPASGTSPEHGDVGRTRGAGTPDGVGLGSLAAQAAAQLPAALRKLDPRYLWRSPVLFLVWLGSLAVTIAAVTDPSLFTASIAVWLWLTVLFGNLAEAVAEGRGKAQAASLRATRSDALARVVQADGSTVSVPGTQLAVGDRVLVEAGEIIPGDGDVVDGIAAVDESAITGESAPVIREAGGDRSAVTGGTRVLSDRILVEVTAAAGDTFLDKMIALVEGTSRRKTPNELALSVLLASLSLVFLLAVASLAPWRTTRAPRRVWSSWSPSWCA